MPVTRILAVRQVRVGKILNGVQGALPHARNANLGGTPSSRRKNTEWGAGGVAPCP
jgi:hypothetical protein